MADLDAVRKVADEDVTRFGEELQRLDADLLTDDPRRGHPAGLPARARLLRVRQGLAGPGHPRPRTSGT